MPRVMWKRTGVLVTLCAGLILFLVVFVLPFVWLVRMGWKRARMYNSGHVDVPRS